jgi:hypothetical protein
VATIHDPRMTWQTDYVNPRREARRITWYLLVTDATETVQREALFPEGGFFAPGAAMRKLAFDEDRAVLRGALKAAARAGLLAADAEPSERAAGGAGAADAEKASPGDQTAHRASRRRGSRRGGSRRGGPRGAVVKQEGTSVPLRPPRGDPGTDGGES